MHSRNIDRIRSVSFSGIDGAGKSTQIQALCTRIEQLGLRVRSIVFWDDVAMLSALRETAGHKVFKGDKGVGAPSAPIDRRDKNVQSRLMTCLRLCLYLLDALSTRLAAEKALRSGADFVIFDRYIYDELANLSLRNPAIRIYVRLIMTLVPRPDVSFLLDADPVAARARKPEYPLEFLHTNRQSYLRLSSLIGEMTIIDPNPVAEVERQVLEHALKDLAVADTRRRSDDGLTRTAGAAASTAKLDRAQTGTATS